MQLRKTSAAFVVAALILGLGGEAHAQNHAAPPAGVGRLRAAVGRVFHREQATPRTPEEAKAALLEAGQAAGMPTYVGANGKVYVNPHNQGHIDALEKLSPEGSGVFVLAQIKGTQHTLAVFENRLLHFQTYNWQDWRIRSWGTKLRPSGHQMNTTMIQLTPTEAANMRQRIAGMFNEQGPEGTNGHVDARGVGGFSCTVGWCSMRIGENNESLGELVGVPHQYHPFEANTNFERHGNERVFGIGIFGPAVPNFGMNPRETQTKPQ